MTNQEKDEKREAACEESIRGERMQPSRRLQRRLSRWIDTKVEEGSAPVHRAWKGWNWAAALGAAVLLAVVIFPRGEPGSGEQSLDPAVEMRAAQPSPGEHLGLEDLLADMDLLVFAHVEEFIFYDWMVY